MKKVLFFMTAMLFMMFIASCTQTNSNGGKEMSDTIPKKPKPTIVGDWYGVKYSHDTTCWKKGFPIACGARNHCYFYSFFSFKNDGKLALFDLPGGGGDYKFKWSDKGEYISVTDEFDRPTDIAMQIIELTDSMCRLRYNENGHDTYIEFSRNPNKRREYFEWWFKRLGKDVDKYKDSDEWKIDRELYSVSL